MDKYFNYFSVAIGILGCGFALMSPDVFRWKVNVNYDGTLSTNRMV